MAATLADVDAALQNEANVEKTLASEIAQVNTDLQALLQKPAGTDLTPELTQIQANTQALSDALAAVQNVDAQEVAAEQPAPAPAPAPASEPEAPAAEAPAAE